MDYKLGEAESRFAALVWDNAPVSSRALVALCGERLGWKKSTTYTVLRRLCDKGLFINEDGSVRARLSREAFYGARSHRVVAEDFGGSLPAFVAAFSRGKKLSDEEVAALQALIDENRRR
ncbi:MAG: BlaI/MecI/CopY family transcriptional regulator [Oscillospiraceae bacterium]|nr:BlaI/MecI/CopY family transcriptional regulator [Oscillospiraceae bacterium]